MRMLWLALIALLIPGAARGDAPLLYAPFDGTAHAVVSGGDPRERAGAALNYVEGVRGQAVSLRQDVRFDAAGNFNPAAGTFACWVRPEWAGNAPGPNYLFCLYGGDDKLPGWQANRWSLSAGGGRLTFSFYTAEGKYVGVSAPIAAWKAGEWHHVAATWANIGSGKADGELRLYLDGAPAGTPVTGAALPVAKHGKMLDIGRDSDGSPDYAAAALDELYLYARALTPEEIARGVRESRAGTTAAAALAPAPRLRTAPGWTDTERPYRTRVTLPAAKTAREKVFLALPLDIAADLNSLGLRAAVDPASLRLVREGNPAAIPIGLRDGRLEWVDGPVPAGQARTYQLYFRTVAYDTTVPLLARATGGGTPPSTTVRIPDYATDAYNDAWDFDEGDLEAIDQWGNKPEYIRGRTVQNGVLKLEVSDDPYIIWGNMWGQIDGTQRPVKIDVDRYPVLEMRIRQSVPQTTWDLYGRPGTSDNLMHYAFPVSGTGWQTIRIDLRRQANWRGELSAFRIDTTNKVNATVEIDWVRLTPLQEATRGAVEVLGATPAARATLSIPNLRPRVGATQAITVRAQDAAGRPLAGHPVRLTLAPGCDGVLESAPQTPSLALSDGARRALTGPDGTATFQYRASRKAGATADQLEAVAEFAGATPARLTVSTQAGPAHHYVVEPAQPRVLRPGDPPLTITARLADEFGNPVPGGGRALTWSAPDGALTKADARTAPDGSATATYRADPTRWWVIRVAVKDQAGLTGESAPLSALPAGPRPDRVRLLPNGYFAANDKPWLPLGGFYANWVGAQTPDGEWDRRISFTDATEEQTIAWLRFLKENGVTAQRFMLRTHRPNGMEPMDLGGRVNPGLFASFLRYLELAKPFGIRFLLVLHEDYSKPVYCNLGALERWSLPWFTGRNMDALPPFQRRFLRDRDLVTPAGRYTDPDAIACQDLYAKEIISLLKDNPQVFAYELENEMVNCPAEWANHALDVIRSVDPETPACVSHGGGGLFTADPDWWKTNTKIDFYTPHIYPAGTSTPELDYGTAVDILNRYARIGKPSFLGESAGDEFAPSHFGREVRRWTMRDVIWFSLINANPGCFFWNARGSEVAEFKLANAIAGRIDWTTFRRKRPAIAVAVPHSLDDDKWFRSNEGRAAHAMMGRYARHYLDRGVDFDFVRDASAYQLKAGVDRFAPPEAPAQDFSVSTGYQLSALVRDNNAEALVYVRNHAGVKAWELQNKSRSIYLRERKPAPLRITLRIPGRYTVDVWDLDTGQHQQRTLATGETLDLGTTDHDFALHVKK